MKSEAIRVSTQIRCRWLDRLVAHTNMKRANIPHVNKHDYCGEKWNRTVVDSYFSKHWRDTVVVPTIDLRKSK